MVLSESLRDELAGHSAVVDHIQSERYLKLKTQPFGNATLFSKIERTDGVTLGNVAFWHDGDYLKVNVRHE